MQQTNLHIMGRDAAHLYHAQEYIARARQAISVNASIPTEAQLSLVRALEMAEDALTGLRGAIETDMAKELGTDAPPLIEKMSAEEEAQLSASQRRTLAVIRSGKKTPSFWERLKAGFNEGRERGRKNW